MSKQIVKSSGNFAALGDIVSLAFQPGAEEVALRLYEEGTQIAIFTVVDDTNTAQLPTRFFMLSPTELPANFVKFIGALLFGDPLVEAYVVEVTAPPAQSGE